MGSRPYAPRRPDEGAGLDPFGELNPYQDLPWMFHAFVGDPLVQSVRHYGSTKRVIARGLEVR